MIRCCRQGLFSYLDTRSSYAWAARTFTSCPSTRQSARLPDQQRDGHMQMQVPQGRVAVHRTGSLDPHNRG